MTSLQADFPLANKLSLNVPVKIWERLLWPLSSYSIRHLKNIYHICLDDSMDSLRINPEHEHLPEKHVWFDFTRGISLDLTVWVIGKCLLYSIRDSRSYWPGKLLFVYVCVRELACMHACFWMCACVYVWVCACKFSISPWATPTHVHVSHSVSEKGPVRQSNLYPNWYDCRLAPFIFIFTDFSANCAGLHRQQSCFRLWGRRLETRYVHYS